MHSRVAEIRRDFPFLERRINGKSIIYLDSAATTQKPRQVIAALQDYYANHCGNIHRGAHRLALESSELYEAARGRVAQFLRCAENEVIFTRNATDAINLVSRTLPRPGEVLVPLSEHHSNFLPWKAVRPVRHAAIDREGRIDLDDLRRQITDDVALVAVAHVTNVLGVVNPIADIARIVADRGALLLVDASQSAAHLPLDVESLGCDFLVFSGHKMLAPAGIGVLYARGEHLQQMAMYQLGGGTVKKVDSQGYVPNDIPWRFEAGTPNVEGAIALGAAIDYLEDIGFDWIASHDRALMTHALRGLRGVPGVRVHGPEDEGLRCGVIAFNVDGMESQVVARILSERHNIMIRSGFHCANPLHASLQLEPTARVSFCVYNTEDEIDVLVETLQSITRFVSK